MTTLWVGNFLGDYRSWKILYTNISKHTTMLAFKVQFKHINRGLSFCCLISDVALVWAGASSFTFARRNALPLLYLLSLERVSLSSLLIGLTVSEWAFKSKITKEQKNKLHPMRVAPTDTMTHIDIDENSN